MERIRLYLYLNLLFLCPFVLVSQPAESASVSLIKNEYSFNKEVLLEQLQELSSDKYEGRFTGEKGNLMARQFIIDQFEKENVNSLQKNTYEQNFSFNRDGKKFNATNVLGTITGTHFPEKYIVISAHYDHLGIKDGKIYNGADDDASGVCALFAFAAFFKNNPPKHSIILAAFDAEELGLQGAKYYVKNPIVDKKKVIININMDMIGRNTKNELYMVGTRYTNGLKKVLKKFKNTTAIKLIEGHDGADDKEDWTTASDHGAFYEQKIPFLYFGEEDHPDYHKETDEFKNIDPVFYTNAVQLIIAVFEEVDEKFKGQKSRIKK